MITKARAGNLDLEWRKLAVLVIDALLIYKVSEVFIGAQLRQLRDELARNGERVSSH